MGQRFLESAARFLLFYLTLSLLCSPAFSLRQTGLEESKDTKEDLAASLRVPTPSTNSQASLISGAGLEERGRRTTLPDLGLSSDTLEILRRHRIYTKREILKKSPEKLLEWGVSLDDVKQIYKSSRNAAYGYAWRAVPRTQASTQIPLSLWGYLIVSSISCGITESLQSQSFLRRLKKRSGI